MQVNDSHNGQDSKGMKVAKAIGKVMGGIVMFMVNMSISFFKTIAGGFDDKTKKKK